MPAGSFFGNQFNNTRFIVLNLVALARFQLFRLFTSPLLSFSGFPPPTLPRFQMLSLFFLAGNFIFSNIIGRNSAGKLFPYSI